MVTLSSQRGEELKPEMVYSRRAAASLARLLNELGYPPGLLERSEGLSRKLDLDLSSCLQLLSGEVPWTWSNTDLICRTFGKQPSFFFDAEIATVPASARTVPNADGGESTVWCPPSGLGSKVLSKGDTLRHVTRPVARLGAGTVGLYVYRLAEISANDLIVGEQYVVTCAEGLEVVVYDHSTKDAAIFAGCSESTIHRIEHAKSGPMEAIVGEVVGLIIVR